MTVRILQGDCRSVLASLPDASVHCVVSSPPYYGLREYGTATWEGGDPACDHVIGAIRTGLGMAALGEQYRGGGKKAAEPKPLFAKAECPKCGAMRFDQQIGLEETPAEYVAALVAVFREIKRVLRDDGIAWLNLGASYASDAKKGHHKPGDAGKQNRIIERGGQAVARMTLSNQSPVVMACECKSCGICWANLAIPLLRFKQKDLISIPMLVALALQADGWYLRQDNIWAKKNCMPESVRDRTTRAHEYMFMLTKSERYFYDAVAIEEEGEIAAGTRAAKGSDVRSALKDVNGRPPEYYEYTGKRNKRSVWWVATQPFPEAHFATFPPALVEPCILAGTSERGCCVQCGAPWVRLIERVTTGRKQKMTDGWEVDPGAHGTIHRKGRIKGEGGVPVLANVTVGWAASCQCDAGDPVPCTVLDPFAGAFTAPLVADRLQRHAIGIELNRAYCEMAKRRIERDAGLFADLAAD